MNVMKTTVQRPPHSSGDVGLRSPNFGLPASRPHAKMLKGRAHTGPSVRRQRLNVQSLPEAWNPPADLLALSRFSGAGWSPVMCAIEMSPHHASVFQDMPLRGFTDTILLAKPNIRHCVTVPSHRQTEKLLFASTVDRSSLRLCCYRMKFRTIRWITKNRHETTAFKIPSVALSAMSRNSAHTFFHFPRSGFGNATLNALLADARLASCLRYTWSFANLLEIMNYAPSRGCHINLGTNEQTKSVPKREEHHVLSSLGFGMVDSMQPHQSRPATCIARQSSVFETS